MTSLNYKISVIVPVYNQELFLKRCLDSICQQTLQDIEIICIDDCSSDNSYKILEEYSRNNRNLTVLSLKKNQGVSGARNAGLSVVRGEYLSFIDSDDEIDLDFFEKLYDQAKVSDSDIVKGRTIEIDYEGKRNIVAQISESQDNKFLFLTHWCSAIYKRSMIEENKINFSIHHSLGEDLLFLNKAVVAAKELHLVNDVFYYYHRRENSGDSQILSEKKIRSALSVFESIIDNINANVLVSDFIYNFIFHHFIMSCFYLSIRNSEKAMKQSCAKTSMDIFEKCEDKEGIKTFFATTVPNLLILLQNKDQAAIEDILIECRSRMELVLSGLRARIKNKV